MSNSPAYQLTLLRPAGPGRVYKRLRPDGRVEAADNVRKFFHSVESVDTPNCCWTSSAGPRLATPLLSGARPLPTGNR